MIVVAIVPFISVIILQAKYDTSLRNVVGDSVQHRPGNGWRVVRGQRWIQAIHGSTDGPPAISQHPWRARAIHGSCHSSTSTDGLASMHSQFTDHPRFTVILPAPQLIYAQNKCFLRRITSHFPICNMSDIRCVAHEIVQIIAVVRPSFAAVRPSFAAVRGQSRTQAIRGWPGLPH